MAPKDTSRYATIQWVYEGLHKVQEPKHNTCKKSSLKMHQLLQHLHRQHSPMSNTTVIQSATLALIIQNLVYSYKMDMALELIN